MPQLCISKLAPEVTDEGFEIPSDQLRSKVAPSKPHFENNWKSQGGQFIHSLGWASSRLAVWLLQGGQASVCIHWCPSHSRTKRQCKACPSHSLKESVKHTGSTLVVIK